MKASHSYERIENEGVIFILVCFRFAFVEYESRRDADDAYHEMHNKRIGREDVLKIEVRHTAVFLSMISYDEYIC